MLLEQIQECILGLEEHTHTKATKQKIGAILETPNFYPYLTGKQNLKIVCDIKDVSYGMIDPTLKKVGLLARWWFQV